MACASFHFFEDLEIGDFFTGRGGVRKKTAPLTSVRMPDEDCPMGHHPKDTVSIHPDRRTGPEDRRVKIDDKFEHARRNSTTFKGRRKGDEERHNARYAARGSTPVTGAYTYFGRIPIGRAFRTLDGELRVKLDKDTARSAKRVQPLFHYSPSDRVLATPNRDSNLGLAAAAQYAAHACRHYGVKWEADAMQKLRAAWMDRTKTGPSAQKLEKIRQLLGNHFDTLLTDEVEMVQILVDRLETQEKSIEWFQTKIGLRKQEPARRSGRTTRMLLAAIERFSEDQSRTILVIAASPRERYRLSMEALRMIHEIHGRDWAVFEKDRIRRNGIMGSINFVVRSSPETVERDLQMSKDVFVDHFAIETLLAFPKLREQLDR